MGARHLLLGCGNKRDRRIFTQGYEDRESWGELTTADINPKCGADLVFDFEDYAHCGYLPGAMAEDSFDEVHCYEMLEHTADQGDARAFFRQFYWLWRILKPGGLLCATTPKPESPWAWGDPSHRRVIPLESLVFLDQGEYERQVGATAMSDFRGIWHGDFRRVQQGSYGEHSNYWVLEAKK